VIEHVRDEVRRRFDVLLRSEIRLVGFDDRSGPNASMGATP
jgi:UDP-N-acetylenolpyruvoylglucosamine reductase